MGVVWVCAVGQFRKKKNGKEKGHQTRKQLDWKVEMDWFASFDLFEDVYKYWDSVQGQNIHQWTFRTTFHHNICPPASFCFFLHCSPLVPMQAAHVPRSSYLTSEVEFVIFLLRKWKIYMQLRILQKIKRVSENSKFSWSLSSSALL